MGKILTIEYVLYFWGAKTISKTHFWIIVGTIGFFLLISIMPTPRAREKTEFKSDWLNTLDASTTIDDGASIYWEISDLPIELRVDVSLDSLEDVVVYINSVQGVVTDKTQKFIIIP